MHSFLESTNGLKRKITTYGLLEFREWEDLFCLCGALV